MTESRSLDQQTLSPERQTRFSDVCGTLDEIKRMLYEQPEVAASESAQLIALVDDVGAMLPRMSMRLQEYEQFREEFLTLAASLQTVQSPLRQTAGAEASSLTTRLAGGRVLSAEERSEAIAWIEAIRDVASNLEKALYRYKEITLEIGRVYHALKGKRGWVLDETEAQTALGNTRDTEGEPDLAQWLPVSPHRERILRYLHAGRAHLLPADAASEGGGIPIIEFEDGGVIPLPAVRWSDEVGNFYPVDAPPHPRGLEYRDRRD